MFSRSLSKENLRNVLAKIKARIIRSTKKLSRGFTIAEMTVVVAVIGTVTTIALANQASLSNNVLLSNLAYEVALSLREAQTYGISVRAGDSTDGKRGAYGVLFRSDKPLEYYLFHDRNDDQIAQSDEIVDTYKIENQRGNSLIRFCYEAPCDEVRSVDAGVSGGFMSIMFRRPNPEPIFQRGAVDAGGDLVQIPGPSTIVGPAYIVINNQVKNNCKTIVVESTGQIRVDNSATPICVNP